jgi:hypothetical protein
MPGAGRTRELGVQRKVHFAHASNNRAAETTGIPCAMALRLIRDLPGVPGLLAPVASLDSSARLDASVGTSGPHDFTVRIGHARLAQPSRPSHPAPNVRDDREPPLQAEAGRAENKGDSGFGKSELFANRLLNVRNYNDGHVNSAFPRGVAGRSNPVFCSRRPECWPVGEILKSLAIAPAWRRSDPKIPADKRGRQVRRLRLDRRG